MKPRTEITNRNKITQSPVEFVYTFMKYLVFAYTTSIYYLVDSFRMQAAAGNGDASLLKSLVTRRGSSCGNRKVDFVRSATTAPTPK